MAKLKFKNGEAEVVDTDGDHVGFLLDKSASGSPLVINVNGRAAGLTRKQALKLAIAIIKELAS
jgi:hypothetical protein